MTLDIASDNFWCGVCCATFPNSERAAHTHIGPSVFSVPGTVLRGNHTGKLELMPQPEPVEIPDFPSDDAPAEQLLDFGAAIAGLSTPIAQRIVDAYLDKWVRD